VYYSPEQVRHISALDPSNTLLIRKNVDSEKKAAIRKEVGRRVNNVLLF
jgi:hypothetical protein